MPLAILTATIHHTNIDKNTGEHFHLETDYQIDSSNDLEVIQSWVVDGGPYPTSLVDLIDLRTSIREQKGWV